METSESVVRVLRRRWKPAKERLAAQRNDHPTNVRFHRACSWLQLAEQSVTEDDADTRLLAQWVALNALYGQWDPARREPCGDRGAWRSFLDRIRNLDADHTIPALLEKDRKLVLAILDDAYLATFFWRDPSVERALRQTNDRRDAPTWYFEKRYPRLLEETLERVYLLRCQLLHGAATWGGTLNRGCLRRCSAFMDDLMPVVIGVWIDHGCDEDWGPMCYPPQS